MPAKDTPTPKNGAPANKASQTSDKVSQKAAPKTSDSAPSKSEPAHFSGKFDLYSTQLPFLHREYLPEGATKPSFEAVYNKILFYQAKPDFSLRIALGENGGGRFSCVRVENPMSGEELEPIHIRGHPSDRIVFGEFEAAHHSTVGLGAGYIADLNLDTADTGCGMVESGMGALKMRRVWEKEGKELFEGYWSLQICYGPTLRRKNFGCADSYEGAFWAVRALKDAEGKEIGINI